LMTLPASALPVAAAPPCKYRAIVIEGKALRAGDARMV
jgi:hypothetical protein